MLNDFTTFSEAPPFHKHYDFGLCVRGIPPRLFSSSPSTLDCNFFLCWWEDLRKTGQTCSHSILLQTPKGSKLYILEIKERSLDEALTEVCLDTRLPTSCATLRWTASVGARRTPKLEDFSQAGKQSVLGEAE